MKKFSILCSLHKLHPKEILIDQKHFDSTYLKHNTIGLHFYNRSAPVDRDFRFNFSDNKDNKL